MMKQKNNNKKINLSEEQTQQHTHDDDGETWLSYSK